MPDGARCPEVPAAQWCLAGISAAHCLVVPNAACCCLVPGDACCSLVHRARCWWCLVGMSTSAQGPLGPVSVCYPSLPTMVIGAQCLLVPVDCLWLQVPKACKWLLVPSASLCLPPSGDSAWCLPPVGLLVSTVGQCMLVGTGNQCQ